jgi:hypothetical protein
MADEARIYKVTFYNQGQVYEIFARQISQGALFGFIEVEELIFGEKTQVVVDPSEEALEREFADVKRTYLPMHAVIRIDEVEKEGTGRIRSMSDSDGKVTPFPLSYVPTGGEGGSD